MSICSLGQGAQSPEVAMPSIRNKLGNTFATMQEDGKTSNMKVFARLRPMLQREKDAGDRECFAVIDGQVVRATVPNTSVILKNFSQNSQEEIYEDFTYTQAFGPEIGQFVFFRHAVSDIMQSFIEGQNCLIFSSGITNSGKIFTLQGSEGNPGVIPIAMCLFFTSIKHQVFTRTSVKPDNFADILILEDKDSTSETKLKEQLIQLSEQESANKTNSSGNLTESFPFDWCHCFNDDFQYGTDKSLSPEEMKDASAALYMKELSKLSADKQEGLCSIWVSFVEIYDENIYDLLQPDISNRAKLTLVEDQNGEVYVKGAIEICVSSSEEALKLLKLGRRNLRIAANKFNFQFSRSHCIFTLKVIRMDSKENGKVNRISFCDLAGSEHADKYQTSGMHMNEAGYNNTSLLVLGKCLEQLRLNQSMQDKKTLPIKESTLTRLFSSHLLGKGRVVMIVNASPCEYTFDDTLNVLRFSALLKTVKLNNSYLSAVSSSLQNIVDNLSKSRDHFSDVPHIESINTDNSLCEDIHEKDMIDVKLNNSYLSAVSSSLQNIADNLSKSRAYLSHVLHNETINFDHSLWEGIEEREDMIDKLLGLADSLRSNLEAENRAKADLELNIRQAVCRECAKYSDQLLEEQKRICADHIDSLKKVNELKVSNMENMYEKRIDDLLSQLQEYESCPDESSMSINKGNSTLEAKEAQNSKILLASGVPDMAAESRKSPMPVERSVLAILMEECDSLLFKLEKAEAALTERTKEFDLFKSESLKKDIEIESLKKEKKSLEDFVSEKIKIPIADKHCEDLNQKLENYNKSFCKEVTNNDELQSKCMAINNDKTKLEIEKKELEEKLCSITKQLGSLKTDYEHLKQDKLAEEDAHTKYVKELQKYISEKEDKINKLTDNVQTLENEAKLKNEINIGTYKEEIVNLKEEFEKAKLLQDQYAKLEEKSAENEKALKKYTEKNAELEESISEKESRIKELTQSVQTLETYKAEFQNNEIDIAFNREEIVILKEELEKAKLLKEQSDLLCECLERCEFLASNKIKRLGSSSVKHRNEITDMRKQIKEKNASIGELEKGISGKEGRIKELTESIQTLENYKAEFQSIEIDIASYKKEIVNLKEELDKTKSLKDKSDVLCEYLERCEFLAYNKIKLLNSSSIKNLNEITDMRRQIKEKNARIGELEKALRDSQKQVESAPSLQNDVKPQIVCVRKFIRSKVTPIATAITEKPLPKVSKPSTDKMLRNMSNGQTKSANYIEPGERPMSRENTARKVLKRSNSQSAFEVVNTLTNSSKPQCASTGSKIETMTASQQHPVTNTADVAAFKLHELTITLPNANTVVENVKVLPTARKSCDSQPLPNGTGNPSKHFKPTPMSTPKLHAEVDKKMNAGITNANRTSNPLTPESHNQIKLMAAVTTIVPTSSATLVPMAKVPPSLSISRILPDVSVHLSEKGTYPLNEKGHPLSEKSANSKITVTKSEESTRTFKEDVLTSLLVSLGKSGVTVANFSMNETIPETRIAAKSSTDKKELQTIILVNDGTTIENSLSNVANVNKLTDESRASTGRSSQKKPVFKEKSVVSSTDSDVVIRHVADRTKLGEPAKLLNKNKVTHIKLNNGKIIKDGSTVASETSSELMASNNIKNDEVNNISKDSSIKNSTTSIKETLLDKIVNSLIVDELVNKSKDIASDSSRTPVSNRRRSLGTTRPPKVFYNSNDLVAAKRQNAPRIQQIQHQKRLLDANIYKLKMNLQQAHEQVSNKTWNAGRKASNAKDEAKHSSNTSKGGNKRSLSDVNKEDAVNTGENETSPKRRRSLRATQPPTAIRISDDLKAESKVIEPPKLRTSQRKLQEQKKNSSVKKAMQFMGSEIRSAAQSVSSMPTPRVTRGLIKLFNTPRVTRGRIKLLNTDAACKRAGPKWRP